MPADKCPDCPHPLHAEHDQWGGCRHFKRGPSGKLVFCGCTRVPPDKVFALGART